MSSYFDQQARPETGVSLSGSHVVLSGHENQKNSVISATVKTATFI